MINKIDSSTTFSYYSLLPTPGRLRNAISAAFAWIRSCFSAPPPPPLPQITYRKAEDLFFDPTICPEPILTGANHSPSATRDLAPIPNGGNTCFLAALTQGFLGDEEILQAAILACTRAQGRTRQALEIIVDFLSSHSTGRAVPVEKTNRLRTALSLLGMQGVQGPTQQDADEAFVLIWDAITSNLPKGHRLAPTRLFAIDTLSAPKAAPNAHLKAEERTLDAARRIFWEPPQENGGRIDLSFEAQKCSLFPKNHAFHSMMEKFFFEDKSKDPETLMREDASGRVFSFPIASKRMCFETAPERLTIAFKRFNGPRKVDSKVNGIGETLTAPSDYFLDGKTARYRLEGVVFHEGGSPWSGHYTAVRRVQNGYVFASDSTVRGLSQKAFLDHLPTAYMAFYKKI